MPELRNGTSVEDVRLDRLVHFDERSRDFPITAVVPEEIKSGRTWSCGAHLDQGREGACVGFGVSHELAAYPAAVPGVDDNFARGVYADAKKIDSYPGEDYEGTDVLAGVKVAQSRGYFDAYRWCFSVDDILRALSHEGPVVVGTIWKDGMYEPRPSGLITPGEGKVVGGHCYLIRGFSMKKKLKGEGDLGPIFRIRNSWGRDWGQDGDAYITVEDYEKYLMPDSDAVVFTGRHKTPSVPSAAQPVSISNDAPRSVFSDRLRYWHR